MSACDESKTTPCAWGEYYYRNNAIKQYEDVMAGVAKTHNIWFIPVFDVFVAALKKDPSLLPDGLHPSNDGHHVIYEIVKPKLLELLG